MKIIKIAIRIGLSLLVSGSLYSQSLSESEGYSRPSKNDFIKISGVYPHLATFNDGGSNACGIKGVSGDGGEDGIGALVPWAGQLWMVTYSPHCPKGSSDKLYSVDSNLLQHIHPESIGGTPANRMIHTESNQLIIGSYFISAAGKIRVVPLTVMPGRMTATARHLSDPANRVYFYDMEGKIYEVNVHTLAVKKLFEKPVPGWHGKGAYTAQKRFIIANNGEDAGFKLTKDMLEVGNVPQTPEEKGILASWDGNKWSIIERKQFTDVTGPGGIYGSPSEAAPAWSIGWDKRSVILKLLDGGQWYSYRLPKAAHTYDHWGGWYTEWPRIREVGNGKMLMDMHGMMYDFPKAFSRNNSGSILPLNSHLRYIPDFCNWNGQIVIATDETTMLQNPMAGRSQSNLWFGNWKDLKTWGGATGWGGPWVDDSVKAGVPSDPFLMNGFNKKVLHLSDDANEAISFTLEIDKSGNNKWKAYNTITLPPKGYQYFVFPEAFSTAWIRITASKDCKATAFFHYSGATHEEQDTIFNALADITNNELLQTALIRPAAHNKNLQVLNTQNDQPVYNEVNEKLEYVIDRNDSTAQMEKLLALKKHYETDEASVIIRDKTGSFRLPKNSTAYDDFKGRDEREVESERFMLNIQGTFYEVGRESGFAAMRPITTHMKKISDFCTWRGLLVMSGTKPSATEDGHYFTNKKGTGGLWFGAIDDLWKMGKPRGEGGVWKNSLINSGDTSLPYLMTGYDAKKVLLSSDKDVVITLQVNTELNGWHEYKKITIPAGKSVEHVFPDGYSAHWIRAITNKACTATVWFTYK